MRFTVRLTEIHTAERTYTRDEVLTYLAATPDRRISHTKRERLARLSDADLGVLLRAVLTKPAPDVIALLRADFDGLTECADCSWTASQAAPPTPCDGVIRDRGDDEEG